MVMNGIRKKGKIVLLLTAISALTALSGVSLSAYAQSGINDRVDVVMNEAAPSPAVGIESTKERSVPHQPVASKAVPESVSLDEVVAAPFISAAISGFASEGIELPASGYTVESSMEMGTRSVALTWLPESWEQLGPLHEATGTVYIAEFTDADVTSGTGSLTSVRVIKNLGITKDDATSGTIKIRF